MGQARTRGGAAVWIVAALCGGADGASYPPIPNASTPFPWTPNASTPVPWTPSPAPLCPSYDGENGVELQACERGGCAQTVRVPMGKEFDLCDPCHGPVAGVRVTIDEDGARKYIVTAPAMGVTNATVSCGVCSDTLGGNDRHLELACPPPVWDGLSAGTCVWIASGVGGGVAVVAGAYVVARKHRRDPEESLVLLPKVTAADATP